ncbi:Druantia anti-phage system protein DruA [Thermodesulfobacteriota bacterium]
MSINSVIVRPVFKREEGRYKDLMQQHHYLGFIPKIRETLWYIATIDNEWVSLLGFSASALKSKARNEWIGWSYRYQFDRLKLIVNNNRFLILPAWHINNLGSRVISLCLKRIVDDWQSVFGHKVVLAETFVDPTRFSGTVYKPFTILKFM